MQDPTEQLRREEVIKINTEVESDNELQERKRLQSRYGQVWDSQELAEDFQVLGFMAPFVVAIRKSDGKKGSLQFQHFPRFYFSWKED